jgi:hypothetical protein
MLRTNPKSTIKILSVGLLKVLFLKKNEGAFAKVKNQPKGSKATGASTP